MAGQYLQIAFYVQFIISIPVIILWCFTGPVLKGLEDVLKPQEGEGLDPSKVMTSEEWADMTSASWGFAMILMTALPARIVFRNVSSYFGSMKILKPAVRSSVVGITMNLLLGLPLVVGYGIKNFDGYGFYACPTVTLVSSGA